MTAGPQSGGHAGAPAQITAVIAGQGRLAAAVVRALAARGAVPPVAALEGFTPQDLPFGVTATAFRIERLVPFLDWLLDRGVTQVVFAGAVQRPRLDPEMFDGRTATLVPRIVGAMQSGDDAALREVIAIFEEWGLAITGVPAIAPDLVPGAGVLAGTPTTRQLADAQQAAAAVDRLGALDIGQGAVVSGGLVLALETLPGTKAMLDFARRHHALAPGGVLWKAPKPAQDLRIDLPTIGPDTVAQAAAAGLSGIAFRAGATIVLDREQTIDAANAARIALWGVA